MKLSIIIPSYNEADNLLSMVSALADQLDQEAIDYEIILVNDHSTDSTLEVARKLQARYIHLKIFSNPGSPGYGMAVRHGLAHYHGDCVAIMMADGSDSPVDLVNFYQAMMNQQLDCVFGSRFDQGGSVSDYPRLKYLLNRIANHLVRTVFRFDYNDCTNAFKLYSRKTIDGIQPLLSPHFNLTLEMPLKAIVRGYSYAVIPNSWVNRKQGESKLKIKEMGSRYFFIFLYCLIEKYFSKGDYMKAGREK